MAFLAICMYRCKLCLPFFALLTTITGSGIGQESCKGNKEEEAEAEKKKTCEEKHFLYFEHG